MYDEEEEETFSRCTTICVPSPSMTEDGNWKKTQHEQTTMAKKYFHTSIHFSLLI